MGLFKGNLAVQVALHEISTLHQRWVVSYKVDKDLKMIIYNICTRLWKNNKLFAVSQEQQSLMYQNRKQLEPQYYLK